MGAEIFNLSWISAVIDLFVLLGWTLYMVGVAVAIFDLAIESQTGRASVKTTALNIFSTLAQEESTATSQRVKRINRERMKRGEYIAGQAPYGYRYTDRVLTIYEPKAEIVRWIFMSYLNGWSLEELVRDLQIRKIPKQRQRKQRLVPIYS